ncbi:MAG TPA: FAD:protein FMN transferase [Sedimenticola sp.]|nr:FAD:protein FMN transferase [Sedimenticola sp.]
MTRLRVVLPLLLLALSLTACQREEALFQDRFLAFGTLVDLTIAGVPTPRAQAAADAVEADFQQMHRAWHAWDPGPLGRVNRLLETGAPFAAPPSSLPLIRLGKQLAARSDSLFNPAIGRLIDAWGFHRDDPEGGRPPPPEEIERLLRANPRMEDLTLEGIMLRSDNPAVKLDFGAFGKGYGIDRAVEHLKQLGIENAIVNAGGDLRAIGSRNGHPWRIAIRGADGKGVLALLEVKGDESVFTSGNYERYYDWKGKRYHHIIDPRTGYPATGTRSVTVIHDDSTTADAAATALFIAGPASWPRIARQMGIRYVLLVDNAGVLHMNPAMRDRLKLLQTGHEIRIGPPLTGRGAAPLSDGR